MNVCEHVIDGRIFRWRVPPGQSQEMSKVFFFWTPISKKWSLKLNAKWQKYKSKADEYEKKKF